MTTFLAIVLLATLLWLVPPLYRRLRRHYLRGRPLSSEQRQLLPDALPLYPRLTPTMQTELCANISLFLRSKEFVGCGGLKVTEEMRMAVAAHACLLLLGRENRCYPNLYTVLLYPDTYVVEETYSPDGYIESRSRDLREGEAHHRGPVVISWADLAEDIRHPHEGRNVALHEFAHKIDEEDGFFDGRPPFRNADEGRNWAPVLKEEFEKLRRQQQKHRGESESEEEGEEVSVLDPYGAESPAEFFAVATEAFFLIPGEMRSAHPRLYQELYDFYRLDPVALKA